MNEPASGATRTAEAGFHGERVNKETRGDAGGERGTGGEGMLRMRRA